MATRSCCCRDCIGRPIPSRARRTGGAFLRPPAAGKVWQDTSGLRADRHSGPGSNRDRSDRRLAVRGLVLASWSDRQSCLRRACRVDQIPRPTGRRRQQVPRLLPFARRAAPRTAPCRVRRVEPDMLLAPGDAAVRPYPTSINSGGPVLFEAPRDSSRFHAWSARWRHPSRRHTLFAIVPP